jgi:hypothetical protein
LKTNTLSAYIRYLISNQPMKTLILGFMLAFIAVICHSQDHYLRASEINTYIKKPRPDSVKLQINDNNAYYQKAVRVDSNITEDLIYVRAIQFMASKNIQQNYGYEEEGKLIFTTMQELNIDSVYAGDDTRFAGAYAAQFAITLDLKNGRYRYTIHNIEFFREVGYGNKRQTLYDLYVKANNKELKRVAKDAKKLIASFERYITTLTNELYLDIEQKSVIHDTNF